MVDLLARHDLASNIMTAPLSISNDTLPVLDLTSLFPDDETRWSAVQSRNPVADGFFVYAVRSTKIYCRPICKARLARRANVRFFTLAAEAREAGFRACKRCKPDDGCFMPEERAVKRIRDFVAQGEEGEGGSLGEMARRSGLSKWHFHRVFKRTVGVTPVEYMRVRRKGEAIDPSLVNARLSDGATSNSDSPATGNGHDLDWLQEAEHNDSSFECLLLNQEDGRFCSSGHEVCQGKPSHGGMSWMDYLAWPDDDYTVPT